MSWQPCDDPIPGDKQSCDLLETVIVPRARDLGDFEVRRALPSPRKQMVGLFIFFDQMGPAEFLIGKGIDVRPHPHIGLATVTYLFDGEILHRDSLGTLQPIRPGEVNWMTAGKGIAHSERTAPELRQAPSNLFGIQTWIALPADAEEVSPGFTHHKQEDLPFLDAEGKEVRLIVGSGNAHRCRLSRPCSMRMRPCRRGHGYHYRPSMKSAAFMWFPARSVLPATHSTLASFWSSTLEMKSPWLPIPKAG